MAESFENVQARAQEAAGSRARDHSPLLRKLDPRQRMALALFRDHNTITSRDIEKLFGTSQHTARNLLSAWTQAGFLSVAVPAKKSGKHGLASEFRMLVP